MKHTIPQLFYTTGSFPQFGEERKLVLNLITFVSSFTSPLSCLIDFFLKK